MNVTIHEFQQDRLRRYAHQSRRMTRIIRQHCRKHDAGETTEWHTKWVDDFNRMSKLEAKVNRRCSYVVESLADLIEYAKEAA